MLHIRPALPDDHDALWGIIEPVLRAGETYALPHEWSRREALDYWLGAPHQVFVAEDNGHVLGTGFLQPNQKGGGSHVANGGFMTATHATGKGVARALCQHALDLARQQGFRAMQFNFVVSTNSRAIALWESLGFATLTRLPGAFLHPAQGYVDALVMFRSL